MGKRKQHQNKSWASVQYNQSINDKNLLRAKEAAKYLGISVYQLRKNIVPTEWHHCYKKYGNGAKAYFWSKSDLDNYSYNIIKKKNVN